MSTEEYSGSTAAPLPEAKKNIKGSSIVELIACSLDNTAQIESSYTLDHETITAIQTAFSGQDAALQTQIAELIGNALRDGMCWFTV